MNPACPHPLSDAPQKAQRNYRTYVSPASKLLSRTNSLSTDSRRPVAIPTTIRLQAPAAEDIYLYPSHARTSDPDA